MAMESKIMQIGPTVAKEMLTHNMDNNRRLNKEVVRRYARVMRSGGWKLTHQGIAFDDAGNLIDGQHRLSAIVEAGVTVLMMVTYNVSHQPGEVFSIDVGQKRTTQNIMQISGIEDAVYKNMSNVVSNYIRWKMPGSHRAEPAEIIDYIDRHYEDIAKLSEIVTSGHGCKNDNSRRMKAFVAAAMLSALYRGESEDALRKFSAVYRRNDTTDCENYNPRHALNIRDYVRDHRETKELFDRTESAISAFCNNKKSLLVRDNNYPFIQEFDA